MAEQQLRQDKHGCYYWADPEPEQPTEQVEPNRLLATAAEAVGFPTLAPATAVPAVSPADMPPKRTRNRSPRKAADSVVIPPPPPIIRG